MDRKNESKKEEIKRLDSYVNEQGIYTSDTGFTKDDWKDIISDTRITSSETKEALIAWYNQEGHEASCKQISDYMNHEKLTPQYFRTLITGYCKSICTNKKVIINDEGIDRYFPLLMDGHYSVYNGGKFYNWILKPEVVDAIEELRLVDMKPEEEKQQYEPYSKADFLKEAFIDESTYDEIINLLIRKKNIILEGAPGVGKTFIADKIAYSFIGSKNRNCLEKIQFHQSYSYEDFILGFQPDDEGKFVLKPGFFYEFCKKAEKNKEENYFLIIDEINRGNLSKIFGELLMLIEEDKRGKTSVKLAHKNESFSVPENLYIIGLMNTADRSLAIVDYALRRRFSFIDLKPAFDHPLFKETLRSRGCPDHLIDKIITKMNSLNMTIQDDPSLGEGFMIGHSYFCKVTTEEEYQLVIHYDIKPILREYWFEDKSKVEEIVDELLH